MKLFVGLGSWKAARRQTCKNAALLSSSTDCEKASPLYGCMLTLAALPTGEVIFTMLAHPDAVSEVSGKEGFLASRPGHVVDAALPTRRSRETWRQRHRRTAFVSSAPR
jgi:hypothetical protein